ncbi:MAG: rod shape-determining protein RodA [Bacteroidota bacterium]
MNGKSGSIVAIEPATGEVLSFVSGPSYDPNQLTGRKYSNNYKLISTDTMKPLFNRPLMAQYRPGSIFKIAQAMSALQMGVITPETRIFCDRGHPMDCHGEHSNEDLRGAITNSCNPYFYNVLRRMVNKGVTNDPFSDSRIGLADWNKYITSFGFGQKLGIDLPNEKAGLIPTPEYYDRAYGGRPWKFSNIYSISIGEGENLVVPVQMANFAATVANRGYYIAPHIVKQIGKDGNPLPQYLEKHYTKIEAKNFDIAIDAMEAVVDHGTATRARMADIVVCGKTGTVQNEPRPTHSVFIAFAPRENPKIAISVYVEYSGQGARAAASIASLMMEKYLTGTVKRTYLEQYVLAGKIFLKMALDNSSYSRDQRIIGGSVDWPTVGLFALLLLMGWLNIYAVVYDDTATKSFFDISINSGRQMMFIGASLVIIVLIMVIDMRFYETVAYVIYGVAIFVLCLVPIIGKEVGGNKSWLGIGSFGVQPSEFAKFAVALAVAKYIGSVGFRMDNLRNQAILFAMIGVPIGLILLQKDFGTALVFCAFLLAFYREGMSPFILIVGSSAAALFILTLVVPNRHYLELAVVVILGVVIFMGKKNARRIIILTTGALIIVGFIESTQYIVTHLKPHHQSRIKVLIDPSSDLQGEGWNVTQSRSR